jgi:hypothetical protein
MDGSSKKTSAKSKRKTQQDDEAEMIDSSSNQEFVDKMKKRATVTTHGIDNVGDYSVKSHSMQHLSIPLVSRV